MEQLTEKYIVNQELRDRFFSDLKKEIERLGIIVSSCDLDGECHADGLSFYVVAFSKLQNNALLWAEFTDFKGYCLEFDYMKLVEGFQHRVFLHGTVIYDEEEQMNGLLESLLSCIRNLQEDGITDLADFFDSFHFGRISGYFEKNKYFELPHEVAVIISQLACYNGKLPQGAPTSPVITNLICQILDVKVLKLAKQYKLNYTRYADDMTFSTNDKNFLRNLDGFYERLTKLIQHEGFLINEKKTRLQYKDSKQVVTGLVVNKKINVDRIYYKQTRAMANSLYTSGKYSIDNVEGTIEQLEGRFSFINQIDKYNNKLETGCKHGFRELCSREKQYQKFLFYKYFYVSKKPLIITEGKTDILYLKAALKYYCSEYPELIEKNKDGTFTFKIKFLNRTKRLEYFFGLTMDGADSMKSLYKFFTDSKERGYTNYLKYFNEANSDVNPTPIMLILDNELSNKNKPLSKFLNGIATEEQKETLKERLMIQVIQDSHLFLITNPLVEGSDECEIENLFEDSVRDVELDGKTLSLKDDFDINLHYGKDIFSKYVLKNYQSIDFSNFKLILDNIKKVVISKS